MHSSFLMYFLEAGLVVKVVMFLLLLASVMSWVFIFQRARYLKKVKSAVTFFEDKFWSGIDLAQLYTQMDSFESADPAMNEGIAAIFKAGFREYLRLHKQAGQSQGMMEGVQRAMRIATSKEAEKLESHLSFLASVGSVSPYVGLFGTVWGIMTSFQALGKAQGATIAMVAPGISEALVATAMGLFAAIPAVLAYNRYAANVDRFMNTYETFQEEFSSILYRQTDSLSQRTVA